MKKLIILLLLILFTLSLEASKPSRVTITSYTKVLGAGSADTTVVQNISFENDSLGIMLGINQDSVSGSIVYQYTTPSGYTNGVAFLSLPVLVTFTDNERGVFSSGIPKRAGADVTQIYIIIKNDKSVTQTIKVNVYSIKWR